MNKSILKEKCDYYKKVTDLKLNDKEYIMVILDGRCFSKLVKPKYELPFSEVLIKIMNETASYVCKNVAGCRLAYVQSDEISLVLTTFNPDSNSFFSGRLTKLLSLIPGLATGYFNKLAIQNLIPKDNKGDVLCSANDISEIIESYEPIEFDAKVWTVPSIDNCFDWFLFRQLDCIRNSKQQHAQSYLSHDELVGKSGNEQCKKVLEKFGVDWNSYSDDKKYGRFIWKEFIKNDVGAMRSRWNAHNAWELSRKEGKEKFLGLKIIPDKKVTLP